MGKVSFLTHISYNDGKAAYLKNDYRSIIAHIDINFTLEFRIDGTPRLLVIPFFATLPKLIQHSPFINFGEFCQPPLLFQTPRLLIHVHSR